MTGTQRQNRPLKWGLFALFWTLLGLSFASQFYLSSLKLGRTISWSQAVQWSLGDWYVWALVSLFVVRLARRFHLEGTALKRNLGLHLFFSALVSLAYMVLRATLAVVQSRLGGVSASFNEAFMPLLFKTFHFNVLIYWVIVAVSHALDYYEQYRARERQSMELETSLVQARLQSLQMQLNPHFLFNTLHAISALMHRDVDAADRMIVHLSDLLRYTLESGDTHEVPLRQELDFLGRYLHIEQTRFGSRLKVKVEVPEEVMEAQVPNLLLQPLVENAIQHGIEQETRPGEITISAAREGDELILLVSDNGAGLEAGWKPGVGLSNSRSRLEQLYQNRARLELTAGAVNGVITRVILPYRV